MMIYKQMKIAQVLVRRITGTVHLLWQVNNIIPDCSIKRESRQRKHSPVVNCCIKRVRRIIIWILQLYNFHRDKH